MSDWHIVLHAGTPVQRDIVYKNIGPAVPTYSAAAVRAQLAEVEQLFTARVLRFPAVGWHAWGVRLPHRGFLVTGRFSPEHPYEAPLIYLDPAPVDRHYHVHLGETQPRLCWCLPGEWHPRYRFVVAVGTALRFINEHYLGRTQ